MDGLQLLVNEFLGCHPDCIECVQWMTLPDGSREMMMRADTMPTFAAWAVKHKGVDPRRAAKTLAHVEHAVKKLKT